MIVSLFARLRGRRAQQGYVYVGGDEASPFAAAAAGEVVRTATDQRWFVVSHDLSRVIVAGWPGRLWRVEIVEPISNEDPRVADQGALRADAGWTRAAAVKAVEEIPATILFGGHGKAIASIAQTAGELTLAEVQRLASARHVNAAHAQTETWRHWLADQPEAALRPEHAIRLVVSPQTEADSLDGTLDIFLRGQGRSPVGAGLSVVSRALSQRAKELAGPSVWETRENDPEGAWLGEPWATGSLALIDAALAFGAPEHVSERNRAILTKAWREVVGQDL